MRPSLLSLARFIHRFRADRQGAAALEFALLLPVFMFLYLCVIEFAQGFMVQRRAAHSASMMADIVAQSGTVSTSQLTEFFGVGGLIMMPYSKVPLEGRVTSIVRNNRGENRVAWSHGSSMARMPYNERIYDVPDGLLEQTGDSVILAETVYKYDSPFDIAVPGFPDFLSGVTTFRRHFYLKPREVASVTCTDCPRT